MSLRKNESRVVCEVTFCLHCKIGDWLHVWSINIDHLVSPVVEYESEHRRRNYISRRSLGIFFWPKNIKFPLGAIFRKQLFFLRVRFSPRREFVNTGGVSLGRPVQGNQIACNHASTFIRRRRRRFSQKKLLFQFLNVFYVFKKNSWIENFSIFSNFSEGTGEDRLSSIVPLNLWRPLDKFMNIQLAAAGWWQASWQNQAAGL